jgi:hypothetical protein
MKIKDLPEDADLGGIRFRYPGDSKIYSWVSQWQRGVWGKLHPEDTQLFPLFCDNLTDALEWEVVE